MATQSRKEPLEMATNDNHFREERTKNKRTLEDIAKELAKLILRTYERELEKKGGIEDGE